jgi:hypothetical protein
MRANDSWFCYSRTAYLFLSNILMIGLVSERRRTSLNPAFRKATGVPG